MPFMTWSDEFSVGVAMFDKEHQELVAIINRFHEAACTGTGGEELSRICDELIEHTVAHLQHEEALFEDTAYPKAALHRVMHQNLKTRALQFRDEVGQKKSLESLRFLKEILAHHIQGEDKKYGAYLNSKGIH